MAKNKPEVVDEVEVAEEVAEEVVTPKAKAAARDSVTVVWRAGSREYTRATHGEDFEALATEFAEKKNGSLV